MSKKNRNKTDTFTKTLYLSFKSSSSGGDAINPEERWSSRTDTIYEFHPTGISVAKPGDSEYEAVEVNQDIQIGDTVYAVIVRYSDGDSFGSSYGHWAVQDIVSSANRAEEIGKEINAGTYKNGAYVPWTGYFSRLSGVEIHRFVVSEMAPGEQGGIRWFDH